MWSTGGKTLTEENLSTRKKTSPRATLFTRYYTQTSLESKVGVCGEEQESNSFLNGTTAGAPMARTTIPNISKVTQHVILFTDYQFSLVPSSILAYGSSL